jgi:hypothetical protein
MVAGSSVKVIWKARRGSAEAVGAAEALERVLGQPAPAGAAQRVQGVVALQLVGLGDPVAVLMGCPPALIPPRGWARTG